MKNNSEIMIYRIILIWLSIVLKILPYSTEIECYIKTLIKVLPALHILIYLNATKLKYMGISYYALSIFRNG